MGKDCLFSKPADVRSLQQLAAVVRKSPARTTNYMPSSTDIFVGFAILEKVIPGLTCYKLPSRKFEAGKQQATRMLFVFTSFQIRVAPEIRCFHQTQGKPLSQPPERCGNLVPLRENRSDKL